MLTRCFRPEVEAGRIELDDGFAAVAVARLNLLTSRCRLNTGHLLSQPPDAATNPGKAVISVLSSTDGVERSA